MEHQITDPRKTYMFGREMRNWTTSLDLNTWIHDPIRFQDWLEHSKPGSTVGFAHDVKRDCVSQYLFAKTRRVFFSGGPLIIDEAENIIYRIPEWVTAFTREIDKRMSEKGSKEINREDALLLVRQLIEAIKEKASEPSLESLMKQGGGPDIRQL